MSRGSLADRITQFLERISDTTRRAALEVQMQIAYEYVEDGLSISVPIAFVQASKVAIRTDALGTPLRSWLDPVVQTCTIWFMDSKPATTPGSGFCFVVTVWASGDTNAPLPLATLSVPVADIDPPLG